MTDLITVISTAITTIKTTLEINKVVKDTDLQIEKGKSNIQVLELQEKLIEAKDLLLKAREEIIQNRNAIQEKNSEISRLNSLIENKSKKLLEGNIISQHDDLPNECLEILKLLTKAEELDSFSIAHYLQMPEQKVKYFSNKLENRGLISYGVQTEVGAMYHLNEKSREFLFDKGLL